MENIQGQWDNFMASAIAWAPRVIAAIISALLIYLIGLWLICLIKRFSRKAFERRGLDISLQRFLNNLISWVLNVLLFIVVITQLGVQTSAFIAIIGDAGLAIGLAGIAIQFCRRGTHPCFETFPGGRFYRVKFGDFRNRQGN